MWAVQKNAMMDSNFPIRKKNTFHSHSTSWTQNILHTSFQSFLQESCEEGQNLQLNYCRWSSLYFLREGSESVVKALLPELLGNESGIFHIQTGVLPLGYVIKEKALCYTFLALQRSQTFSFPQPLY